MLVCKVLELSISFFLVSLVEDEILKEVEVILRETFVSQLGVFSKDISSKVIMLIFAVEKDQVREGFWRERRVIKQEVKLLETATRVLLNVHESLVMESNWIQFIFISGRHVKESLS